jgi:hypothetical protein
LRLRCDQRAFKAFTGLEKQFGPIDPDQPQAGYLVVPETLTEEEWIAKYSPKDPPPGEVETLD